MKFHSSCTVMSSIRYIRMCLSVSHSAMCVGLLLIVFIKLICNIRVHWWVKRPHQTYQQLARHF